MSPLLCARLAGIVPVVVLAVTAAGPSAASPTTPTENGVARSRQAPWGEAVTSLVSRSSAGVQAQGASREATISARGRYVAFTSSAGNLGGLDSVGDDVFVRDRLTGRTTLVSQGGHGQRPNGPSGHPSISADGRFVAFSSTAGNLVMRDSNAASDVFVRDVRRGTTRRVSVGPRGAEANDLSVLPRISADGRHVVFVSEATNLVPGDTNDALDVFVHDVRRGVTTRVSLSDDDRQAIGGSVEPDISGNGRRVVFFNSTSRLGPGGTTNGAMFVRDRRRGTTQHVIQRTTDGALPNGTTGVPRISADGRHVAFVSTATNLVAGDTNGSADVFLSDLRTGRISRASVTTAGEEVNGSSTNPSVSAFGRYVAFVSDATNLGSPAPPARPVQEVYVHDVRRNTTHAVSVGADGIPGNSGSVRPELSLDGRHLAFESGADNLVPDDTNGTFDVFARDTVGDARRFGLR
jgi:Tol biopolymer transport system component